MWQSIGNAVLAGLFSTIVLYIVKGFFTNLEERVKRVEDNVDKKLGSINTKIETLQNRYGEIFNELLGKFSNWEDRIKGIMDEVVKKSISGGNVDIREYALGSMKDLDKEIEKELHNIKLEIKSIDEELTTLEKETEQKQSSSLIKTNELYVFTHKSFRKTNEDITTLRIKLEKTSNRMAEKIMMLHSVCKSVVEDNRKLENKFIEFQKINTTKIQLLDKKKH